MKKVKKSLTLILSLIMVFAAVIPAFADQSTTTVKTIYKDINPNTEIYAVTSEPGSSYPYYGAKYEPKGGVYFGRTAEAGALESGRWVVLNESEADKESIVSLYTNLGNENPISAYSWIFGAVTDDDNHALLINLNINDIELLPLVVSGSYDDFLKTDLSYLGTLTYPVFYRIGGEMNLWAEGHAEEFISAYQYIANIARKLAPNVALVFSPNFTGSTNVDMDSFYPGDEYVDWVGASLYYNKYPIEGETNFNGWQAFYGVDEFGDSVLNVQQVRNLAIMHSKPLMLTEGGSSWYQFGQDATDFAAARVEKAMATLSMIYPEIKAIVYSDTDFGNPEERYSLLNNPTVAAAHDAGVAVNQTLLHGLNGSYSYYTKASELDPLWTGDVQLAAYTYYSGLDKLSATWTVDGGAAQTVATYPYSYTVKTSALADGAHTVKVNFSNGESKEYKFYVGKIEEAASGLSNFTKTQEYKAGIFNDIDENGWYIDNIKKAYELGLMKGAGEGLFNPDGDITIIETITMAARIHSIYSTGTNNFVQGTPWYQVYVDYAVANGIIEAGEYPDLNAKATREQFTYILSKSIPAAEFTAINNVAAGKIPDVSMTSEYADEIYMFYRAGILTGNDEKGTFAPSTNIGRSSVAAIVTRIVDPSLRRSLTL